MYEIVDVFNYSIKNSLVRHMFSLINVLQQNVLWKIILTIKFERAFNWKT